MSAAISCHNFSQNAWKKDLCSNCFKQRDEHSIEAIKGIVKRNGISNIHTTTKTNGHLSIIKSKTNGEGKKNGFKKRNVFFPKEESEVIGYGGGETWSDEEIESDNETNSTSSNNNNSSDSDTETDINGDTEEEKELRRLTKSNTDFNTINANLLVPEVEKNNKCEQTEQTESRRRSFTRLMLGRPQVDSAGKKQTLQVAVMPFGTPLSNGSTNAKETIVIKKKEPVKIEKKQTHVSIAKNKDMIPETRPSVILMSYSKSGDNPEETETKEEKSLLDEIDETLLKNNCDVQIKNYKNVVQNGKKVQDNKIVKVNEKNQNNEKTNDGTQINKTRTIQNGIDKKNEDVSVDKKQKNKIQIVGERVKNNVNEKSDIKKITLARNTAFRQDCEKPFIFQGNKACEENVTELDSFGLSDKKETIVEAKSPILVKTEIKFTPTNLSTQDTTKINSVIKYKSTVSEIKKDESANLKKTDVVSGFKIVEFDITDNSETCTERKIVGETVQKLSFEETSEKLFDLPPIVPKLTDSVFSSRESAGEPDGRADSDDSVEPPALPSSPPPTSDPRPSFLHSVAKRPADKPKVPLKPNKVVQTNTVKKIVNVSLNDEDSNKVEPINTEPELKEDETVYENIKECSKLPLTKQDSNNSDICRKRKAPKPPALETDTSQVFTRNISGNAKSLSPVVKEKERRERLVSSCPKFKDGIITESITFEFNKSGADAGPLNFESNNNYEKNDLMFDENIKITKYQLSESDSFTSRESLSTNEENVENSKSGVDVVKKIHFSNEMEEKQYTMSTTPRELQCSEKNLSISADLNNSLPEPAPRRSLSQSHDCLSSIDDKKKARGKFSLKKFLRMGVNRDSEKTDYSVNNRIKSEDVRLSGTPQPKPRLVIVHPLDLNGMEVEVVKTELNGSNAKLPSPNIHSTYDNHNLKFISPILDSPTYDSPRPKKPPPPPRNDWKNNRPSRPPPPKNISLQNNKPNVVKAALSSTDNIYANVGEVRASLAPSKPVRTASMREREAALEKRRHVKLLSEHNQRSVAIDHSYEVVDIGNTKTEHLYDYLNGRRSSSPECDSSKERRLKICNTCKKSDSGENSMDCCRNQVSQGRINSMQYCGSETESEIYSPYSFCGSEMDLADEDSDWTNTKFCRLRSRKGRSVVHKNLEDNYGAVVVANHEALAQILEQINQMPTPPCLRTLQSAPQLRFADFSLVDQPSTSTFGRHSFHSALWGPQQIRVTLQLTAGTTSLWPPACAPFCLTSVVEFSDLVPASFVGSSGEDVQATISVLPWLHIDPLTSRSWTAVRDGCFALLQLVHVLKCLQALGTEELPLSLTNFILCRDPNADNSQAMGITTSSHQNLPRVCLLHGLFEETTNATDKDTKFGSLCSVVLTAVPLLLPPSAPETLTTLLKTHLEREHTNSLTTVRSVLEYFLWGPTDVTNSLSERRDRELALQRWLDLERATALQSLVGSRGKLSVYERCHLLFLVRSSARNLCDAASFLEEVCDR